MLHFDLFEFSESERAALRAAHDTGTLRARDNRSDCAADCDGLEDARRIGERIADGFDLLAGDGDGAS